MENINNEIIFIENIINLLDAILKVNSQGEKELIMKKVKHSIWDGLDISDELLDDLLFDIAYQLDMYEPNDNYRIDTSDYYDDNELVLKVNSAIKLLKLNLERYKKYIKFPNENEFIKSYNIIDTDKSRIEISKELASYFPELRPYTYSRLYKILGCFIVGFELKPCFYGDYSTTMVRFYIRYLLTEPLYNNDSISSLHLFRGLLWGDQSFIDSRIYKEDCAKAVKYFKEKINFPLEGDIKLDSLFELCNKKNLLIGRHYGFDVKFYASMYVNSKYHINLVLNEIMKRGIKVYDEDIYHYLNNRKEFISRVEQKRNDPKLKRLIKSEIIL